MSWRCLNGARVNPEIENLLKLQDFYDRRKQKQKERDTLPPELADVDREFRQKGETIEMLRKQLADAERQRRAAEGRLAELSEKQKKFQTQLMGVKNSKEYGAALNEIDMVKKEIRGVEDEAVDLMETIETARRDLGEREEAFPEEKAEHDRALAGWRNTQKEIDAEVARISSDIQELEKSFSRKKLDEFYRLFERKGGQAVVRTSGPSCPACHVRLRPALYQALRLSGEVVACDSCKRILYYAEETVAAS